MKYLAKTNFTTGESPEGAAHDKGYVWKKGSPYTGDQAERLVKEGLIEQVEVAPSDSEAPAMGQVDESNAEDASEEHVPAVGAHHKHHKEKSEKRK